MNYYVWRHDQGQFQKYTINRGEVGIGLQIRTADIDGDGDQDIVVAGKEGTPALGQSQQIDDPSPRMPTAYMHAPAKATDQAGAPAFSSKGRSYVSPGCNPGLLRTHLDRAALHLTWAVPVGLCAE